MLRGRIATGSGLIVRKPDHQSEVAARRTACDGDLIRIDAKLLRMRPHPADGVAAISDVLRPDAFLGLGAENVVTTHDNVARAAEVGADAGGTILGLVAAREAAAVDEHHGGAIGAKIA